MIFHRKTSAKRGGKNIREEISSNYRTAAGKSHRGISDKDKHLPTSHCFE